MNAFIQIDPTDQNKIMGKFNCPQPSLSDVHLIDETRLVPFTEPCYNVATDTLSEYVKTSAEIIAEYEARVQVLLDTTAQKKGYDSALSCVSYAGGTSSFATEGAAILAWRENVWAYCYQQAALLPTATPPIPTADQFIAALLTAYPAPW